MKLRELIIDLLTASRYVRWLETRHQEQRQDYETRLGEKDKRVHQLEVELAGTKLECDRMRLVLMPLGSPAGALYASQYQRPVKPEFNGPPQFEDGPLIGWQAELEHLMNWKEPKDGLHGEGRNEVDQSRTDDAKESLS